MTPKQFSRTCLGIFAILILTFTPLSQITSASALTTQNTITINALTANNEQLHIFTEIKSHGMTLKKGFTPLTFVGIQGRDYMVSVSNRDNTTPNHWQDDFDKDTTFNHQQDNGNIATIFSHWQDDGTTDSSRTINLQQNAAFTAIYNMGDRITFEDLGVLQLVAHDLYNVDRTTNVDSEDDKLNLSTILDYGQDKIATGGEPRNSENILVHTVAVDLGNKYLQFLNEGKTTDQARHLTVQIYLHEIKVAYLNTFPGPFPKPDPNADQAFANDLDGDLALRTLHSFLPGTVMVDGKRTPILDLSLQGKTLSKKEMMQLSKPLDGTFDPAFRNITVFLPPSTTFTIDLLERDSSFAQQFNTDFTFEQFLDELRDGKFNKNEQVMKVIQADFAGSQVGIP